MSAKLKTKKKKKKLSKKVDEKIYICKIKIKKKKKSSKLYHTKNSKTGRLEGEKYKPR